MKAHKLCRAVGLALLGALFSWAAQALEVSVTPIDANGNPTGDPIIVSNSEGSTVNLDSDTPTPGSRRTYGSITIQQCPNCAGRARVFVSEGSVSRLVFTDALITNNGTATAGLLIRTGATLTTSGPAGDYPFATELSGNFTAPLGQLATDPANRIEVTATTNAGNCDADACMIDNPAIDVGEGTDPSKYSIVAPPFLAAGAASFAPREQQLMRCNNVYDGETGDQFCRPTLALSAKITLKPKHAARIPGSIGTFHVPQLCETGHTAGCEIMNDFLVSLGGAANGLKVYDVRLEPSPGADRQLQFRTYPTFNSSEAWVTGRSNKEDDDDDRGNNSDGIVSGTRARLTTGGAADIRARGLCPATGCPTSNVLPVRVYCGPDIVAMSLLHLNQKGDGRETVIFGVPCSDPGVIIMHPTESDNWVAAPGITGGR